MPQRPTTPISAERKLAAMLVVVNQLQPALARNDRAKQVEAVRKLVSMDAPMGEQWLSLAGIAARHGEFSLGHAAIDRLIEAFDGAPEAQYQKVLLLEQAGALREAADLMRTLPDSVPDPVDNACVRGAHALFLGEPDEARSQLDRALELQPQSGSAWLLLATAADLASEPELAERIIAAEPGMADAAPAHRAAYHYAKGRAHAVRGEHALAFAAFTSGAREMKALTPYDRQADRNDAENAMRGYSAASIAAIAARQNEPTDRAIFVTGLPRSGTTLVERILTRHSAVAAGGEIDRLPLLAGEIGGASHAALARYVEKDGVAGIARLWRHLLDERVPAAGRVIDKSLNTTRLAGLAAALLPEAPLVWVTRDPLDRAWSCFRTFFPVSVPWSCDLEDIAFVFRLEDRLLQHWQDTLGERLLTVSYEALIEDPEVWIRRILAHCGLAEEAQPFAPQDNRRPVTTASMMQVRRPINREGIGAAEPYREFLQPFVDAYYG